MTFPRDKPRSFRETTDLSWDEMDSLIESILGLTLGILECTMVGHACIHKIHHLVCSHDQVAYILYQCHHHLVYSNVVLLVMICGRIRAVEVMKINSKGERQGFAGNGNERAQNESFVDKHRGDEMEDEVLPRARNIKLFLKRVKDVIPIKVQTLVMTHNPLVAHLKKTYLMVQDLQVDT